MKEIKKRWEPLVLVRFVFENFILISYAEAEISNKDFNETYVWTKTGDTMFLRDNEGKLVLWEGY